MARKQSWLAERVARNVDKMLAGGAGAKEAADEFNLDASTFGSVVAGMLEGNSPMRISRVTDEAARKSLDQIKGLFGDVSGNVDQIFKASPHLLEARKAADTV